MKRIFWSVKNIALTSAIVCMVIATCLFTASLYVQNGQAKAKSAVEHNAKMTTSTDLMVNVSK